MSVWLTDRRDPFSTNSPLVYAGQFAFRLCILMGLRNPETDLVIEMRAMEERKPESLVSS